LDKRINELTLQLPASLLAAGVTNTKDSVASLAFLGSPSYSYTASARYRLPIASDLGNVSVGFRYFGISPVDYGSVLAPKGKKLDLRLDWMAIAQSGFDASAFVTNLTNDAYPIAPNNSNEGLSINSGIYNEPRIVGVQLRYSFSGK
jgi:outer membrane receptor protein involved in Fe transport